MSDSSARSTGHRAARAGGRGAAGAEDVAVLLVSHDGARWLPTVLAGLAEQQAPIACGSRSTRAARTRAAACSRRRSAPTGSSRRRPRRRTPPPSGWARAAGDQRGDRVKPEWVWLLHDDASPHPEALLALLAGAAEDPEADVLGPMLREWPSLRAVLELGVTLSGTGRRETGLERGEYDQGQYAEVRPGPRGQHRGHAGAPPGPRGARRVRRRAARCSATTWTSGGGRPAPGTARSWCRRRSCSTPRPRIAECARHR